LSDVPELVTLHVWRVPPFRVPAAAMRMATDRGRARRTPGVVFAKLLGTANGFSAFDAEPTRWAALTCWSTAAAAARYPVADRWDASASESWRLDLRPLSSRGQWSRRTPFGSPTPRRVDGPVASITRARLVPRKALGFFRAVPPVSAELAAADGLLASLGVAEMPLGLQGTVSLWRDSTALRAFATAPEHTEAVRRTTSDGWYAEELFARFEVVGSRGTLDGRDPLA
jgi:hypothetical protein